MLSACGTQPDARYEEGTEAGDLDTLRIRALSSSATHGGFSRYLLFTEAYAKDSVPKL